MTAGKVRLVILGCGEISKTQHLPAALSHPAVEIAALVDSNPQRADALARSFGIPCRTAADYQSVLADADAVLNALPNALHAPATMDLLQQGKHVLCEKPLATTSADAGACAALAAERGLVLAVGMNRRFDSNHPLLHSVLRGQQIGKIKSYDWQYGGEFEWKSASAFYFTRGLAGGGVLMDFGVHLLDSLVSWFGPVTEVRYQDDDWGGGVEANCILDLRHEGEYGPVAGRVQMSRTVTLRNRLLVSGTVADAEIRVGESNAVFLRREIAGASVIDALQAAEDSGQSSFFKQLDNFVESIRGNQKPEVDGEQAARTIELIESCYAHRERIAEPWSDLGAGVSAGA